MPAATTFEEVMGKCADYKTGRSVLKLVPDFLHHAGGDAHNSWRNILSCTSEGAGLGVRKDYVKNRMSFDGSSRLKFSNGPIGW